jgi:hypothetical protein
MANVKGDAALYRCCARWAEGSAVIQHAFGAAVADVRHDVAAVQ